MTLSTPATSFRSGRLKIVHVVASINRDVGGPSVTVPRLASALAALDTDATLATLDYDSHGPQPAVPGVRLLSRPAGRMARALRGWDPHFATAISDLVHGDANIVHGHGLWMFPNLYARRAAVSSGIPLVISPRGMLDEWSLRRSRWRKLAAWTLFERRNLKSAQLFHATSTAEALSIAGVGFGQPIAVIPNGVDIPDSSRLPGRQVLERRYPGLGGKQWLLFMSRLHPKKGIAELLRAWRNLAPRFLDWQLVIAGPDLDGHGARMRTLAVELGLSERITFTGMVSGDDKASALANAGVMVLPTHAENFGIVVAEALAHGTPVITTRAAPWQGLQEAGCGWWIEDQEEALQETLGEAMRVSPGERSAMGARGRALVESRYSWDRVGREMLAAYNWISGRGQRPDCVQR